MPRRALLRFLADESGSTASEYAIMASLVAGVIVAAVTALGISVTALFQQVLDGFSGGS
ncbi:MAG: Flp family type IVb pilin [Solidesulfovibrio sp. DCME]|uniref:Flp family type IVb pilin n=1 Tax=Solidesulfovibrio sp. DCME TaxID=3447380 RepID=UPI003D139FEA